MTGGSSAVAVVAGAVGVVGLATATTKPSPPADGPTSLGGTGRQSTDQRLDVTGLADLVGQHRGCERGEIGRRNIVERPAGAAGVVVNENYISINADHLTGPKTRHPDIKSFKRSQVDRIIPVGRKGGEHLVQHALEKRLDRIGLRAAVGQRTAVDLFAAACADSGIQSFRGCCSRTPNSIR
jgi:hypothetical protein